MPELPLTLVALATLGRQMRDAQRAARKTGSVAALVCAEAAELRFDAVLASVLAPSLFDRPAPADSAEGEQD
jgi:hypothetical protein